MDTAVTIKKNGCYFYVTTERGQKAFIFLVRFFGGKGAYDMQRPHWTTLGPLLLISYSLLGALHVFWLVDGMPLAYRHPAGDLGVLAGADFLSLIMRSSSTYTMVPPTTLEPFHYARETRSTSPILTFEDLNIGSTTSTTANPNLKSGTTGWVVVPRRRERHYDTNDVVALVNSFNDNKSGKNNSGSTTKITTTMVPPIWVNRHREPIEQNYEVDESVSVMSNGRVYGIQKNVVPQDNPQVKKNNEEDHQKIGYVVEGHNYRKYRLEERTADGFIVGEYGVLSHDDGTLRGVRYTADGTISPRLIYDTLMKFLAL